MVFVWAFLALFMVGCASERIYVGGSDGICRMKLWFEPRVWYGEKVSNAPGVSYMARQGNWLYAARKEAKNAFVVDSYLILKNGDLKALNTFKVPGNTGYCHISLTSDGKFLFLIDVSLQECYGFFQEKMMEQGFTAASRFRFLEVGEVRTLGFPLVSGDDAVSTQRAGVGLSLFGFVDVQNPSF